MAAMLLSEVGRGMKFVSKPLNADAAFTAKVVSIKDSRTAR